MRNRWCRKRMGWGRWLLYRVYQRCDCPAGLCYPLGADGLNPDGPVEYRRERWCRERMGWRRRFRWLYPPCDCAAGRCCMCEIADAEDTPLDLPT